MGKSSAETSELKHCKGLLETATSLILQRTKQLKMSQYLDLAIQDSVKEQLFRCKLHMLERKCSVGVEKLRALLVEHLQNGIPVSEILDKTLSFITLRRALLTHNGYSKYSRDILRIFPDAEDDVAPLCF